jgi:hypothetical protein
VSLVEPETWMAVMKIMSRAKLSPPKLSYNFWTTESSLLIFQSYDAFSRSKLDNMALTVEEQLALINDGLEEVLNPEIIEAIVKDGKALRVYWV